MRIIITHENKVDTSQFDSDIPIIIAILIDDMMSDFVAHGL